MAYMGTENFCRASVRSLKIVINLFNLLKADLEFNFAYDSYNSGLSFPLLPQAQPLIAGNSLNFYPVIVTALQRRTVCIVIRLQGEAMERQARCKDRSGP